MTDDNDYEYSDFISPLSAGRRDNHSNVEEDAPDENALSSILFKAFNEINELGRDRHTLSQVLGRQNFDKLLAKPKVARAVESWEVSSPKTKGAATRMLALSIARAADTPELVDRIQREIQDASVDPFDTTHPLSVTLAAK